MDKRVLYGIVVVSAAAGGLFFFQTQRNDTSGVGERSAPPPSVQSASAATDGVVRYQVEEKGTAAFLIAAPLEQIKGHADRLRGAIDLDTTSLGKSHGEVDVDLDSLVTETFGDPARDKAQTEHAHNWMELGADAPGHEADRWARFTFASATLDGAAGTARLADVPRTGDERRFTLTATGNLWLHGITSPKTVKLVVVASGGSGDAAPSALHVETAADGGMPVSLKEHDVKPRDVAGKFLAGSLEKVGDKITDTAVLRITLDARPAAAGDR